MTLQFSSTLRNDRISCLGAASVTPVSLTHLTIFSGTEPVNCAASDPTGPLVTITPLPTPYLTFSGGVTTLAGVWSAVASAGGLAASFRMYDASAVCHVQGSCVSGSADLVLNNNTVTSGQTVSVTAFTATDANA